jgi:hypothetical protein
MVIDVIIINFIFNYIFSKITEGLTQKTGIRNKWLPRIRAIPYLKVVVFFLLGIIPEFFLGFILREKRS